MEPAMSGQRPPLPPALNDQNGNFCRFDDGQLSRPFDTTPPTSLTHFVHDAFRALVLNERFSCVGARSAVNRNAYRFGLYGEMGGVAAGHGLAGDLQRFAQDETLAGEPFSAFVASFVEPASVHEAEFETLLWSMLQRLHGLDREPWCWTGGSDPNSPDFCFSYAGVGYFVVGLHAGSSRLARRFAWPTLVFNPHDQFNQLRAQGSYRQFQRVIRGRDVALQGTVNPMLSDFGETSEARQYSGRAVGDSWQCPFAAGTRRPAGEEE
jgi:FPC/CPF motif-containing protein YcgG